MTSSRTGQGLDELREAIFRVAAEVSQRGSEGPFRLPVDRVFTLKGIGTVITGTMWEGSVADGDEAVIQPYGRKVRVRNIQVHGEDVERAYAGQRVALNLPGISTEEIERGDVIGTAGYLHPTLMADGLLHLIESAPRPLKNRTRVRFHHGTREVMARVILLGGREELPPGESGLRAVPPGEAGHRALRRPLYPALIFPRHHHRRRAYPRFPPQEAPPPPDGGARNSGKA